MDKKQPLLLIMAMMIFGVALSSAMWVISKNNVTSHREIIVNEISHIAADAFQYIHRPIATGGGGGSYRWYRVPDQFRANEHAGFAAKDSAGEILTIVATSSRGIGTVIAKVDLEGKFLGFSYTGEFTE